MPSEVHYNTSNFTIPAFSPRKESGWSIGTIVSLVGVIIAAFSLIITLWGKFPGRKAGSSSSQPDIEMGIPAPVSHDSAAMTAHSQTSIPEHHNDTHREQANNTTYPIQRGADESQAIFNVVPPNEIRAAASGSTMIEISHHAGTRQEGRPLRFLEPASFSTKNLLGIIGEELGWSPKVSDDAPAIVRPATTP